MFSAAANTEALAEKRVALVIGNANYVNAPKLINPGNDTTAVSIMLEGLGFVVDTRNDLGNSDMRRAVRDFSDQTKDADIAIVYYAGHGIEVNGNNYLVPTDARLQRDIDVEDEAVAVDRVMQMIEPARKLRLVILDACRDNPLSRTMQRTLAASRGRPAMVLRRRPRRRRARWSLLRRAPVPPCRTAQAPTARSRRRW